MKKVCYIFLLEREATVFFFLGDAAMIGKLFPAHKRSRPERPTFRPTLESLENRLAPSAADVSAAYHALFTDMSNLVASMTARPVDHNAVDTNFNAVRSDTLLLEFSARNFVPADRLRIDNALVTSGVSLVYQGFNNFPSISAGEFVSIERLGFSAIEMGALDSLVTGFFPQTSGDSVLT
jgi:hypothetical protein